MKLYGVYFTEYGEAKEWPKLTFASKEAAKRRAATLRSELTAGQKREFGFSYITKEFHEGSK
jgi:hypothetical protein